MNNSTLLCIALAMILLMVILPRTESLSGKIGEPCEPEVPVVNASEYLIYEDEEKEGSKLCRVSKCKDGYALLDGLCVEEGQSCTLDGDEDDNGVYTVKDGACSLTGCVVGYNLTDGQCEAIGGNDDDEEEEGEEEEGEEEEDEEGEEEEESEDDDEEEEEDDEEEEEDDEEEEEEGEEEAEEEEEEEEEGVEGYRLY